MALKQQLDVIAYLEAVESWRDASDRIKKLQQGMEAVKKWLGTMSPGQPPVKTEEWPIHEHLVSYINRLVDARERAEQLWGKLEEPQHPGLKAPKELGLQ